MGREVKNRKKCPTNEGEYKVGPGHPPRERRFGQPNGNPRGRTWKKTDTPRYKMERMITMSAEELREIEGDENAAEFERALADIILQIRDDIDGDCVKRSAAQRFTAMEKMINQVYGAPAQTTVNLNSDMDEDQKAGFIKGIFIPEGDTNDGRGAD